MPAAILGAPRRAPQRSLAASCPSLRRPAGGHEVRVRHRGHHQLRRADRGRLLPAGHAGEAGESPGGRLGAVPSRPALRRLSAARPLTLTGRGGGGSPVPDWEPLGAAGSPVCDLSPPGRPPAGAAEPRLRAAGAADRAGGAGAGPAARRGPGAGRVPLQGVAGRGAAEGRPGDQPRR